MRCKQCGKDNPNGAKYCGYCQYPLEQMAHSKGKKKRFIGILCLAVLIVVIWKSCENRSAEKQLPENSGSVSVQTEVKPVEKSISKSNMLCEKKMLSGGNGDQKVAAGVDIRRSDIYSITFLSTLSDAPVGATDISVNGDSSVLLWFKTNSGKYDMYIAADGNIIAPANCSGLFSCYTMLEEIDFNGCFDTSKVTNMSYMFDYCTFLKKLDLASFNTKKVTNMSGMFSKCMSLASVDVSSFNTSSVTDMSMMFYHCYELKKLDVRNFNTNKVKDMSSMFEACSSLESLDLSNFFTGKDTSLGFMFWKCTNLNELDIRSFDFSEYSYESAERTLFAGENPPKQLVMNIDFETDDFINSGFEDRQNGYDENISGNWSSTSVSVGGTNTHPWIFDKPVKNCLGFTMHYQIVDIDYGKIAGVYSLYYKTVNNKWERLATFDIADQSEIIKTLTFEKPITIMELAVAAPSGRFFSYTSSLWFEDWYLLD